MIRILTWVVVAVSLSEFVVGFIPSIVPSACYGKTVDFCSVSRTYFHKTLPATHKSLRNGLQLRSLTSEMSGDADVRWLPPLMGPSSDPTPGATVIPVFPLGVYVVSKDFFRKLLGFNLIWNFSRNHSTLSIYLNLDIVNCTVIFCLADLEDLRFVLLIPKLEGLQKLPLFSI